MNEEHASSVELKSQLLNVEAVVTEIFAALHDSSLMECRDAAWADNERKSSVNLKLLMPVTVGWV